MNYVRAIFMKHKTWGLLLVVVAMVAPMACGFISPGEAREVLKAGREIRRVETEEIEPLLEQLDSLRYDEIEPRYREIDDLNSQIDRIVGERRESLESEYDSLDGDPGPLMDALRDEADQAFNELEGAYRQIEDEEQ